MTAFTIADQTDPVFQRNANRGLPKRSATASGLEAFTGKWDAHHAAHLLRRTLIGFSKSDLEKALTYSAATCVDELLNVIDETISPPVVTDITSETVALGTTWVLAAYDGTLTGVRGRSLQSWWMNRIMNQGFSIRENTAHLHIFKKG